MSVSSITSNSIYQPNQTSPFAKVKKDFQDINSALQSGSLSSAQSAFAMLQTDTSSKTNSSNNPMSQDIQSLGNALQSGSLSDAQQALTKIQDHLKGHGEFAKQQMAIQESMSSTTGSSTATTGSTSLSTSTTTNPLQQDIQNLGAALQSGNTSDAQKAFATLQNDLASQNSSTSGVAGTGHHHHHHHAAPPTSPEVSTVAATTNSTLAANSSATSLATALTSAISSYMQSSSASYNQTGTSGSLWSSAA